MWRKWYVFNKDELKSIEVADGLNIGDDKRSNQGKRQSFGSGEQPG